MGMKTIAAVAAVLALTFAAGSAHAEESLECHRKASAAGNNYSAVLAACDKREKLGAEAMAILNDLGTRSGLAWLETATPEELDDDVPAAQVAAKRLDEINAAMGLPRDSDKIVKAIAEDVSKERACRASKKCLDARVAAHREEQMAQEVCDANDMREDTLRRIAYEKANPTGVVDLRQLHDLGQDLQSETPALAAMKANFTKVTGKNWRLAMCVAR